MKLTKKHIAAYTLASIAYFIPYCLFHYNIISKYVYFGIIGIPSIIILGLIVYILLEDSRTSTKIKLQLLEEQINSSQEQRNS